MGLVDIKAYCGTGIHDTGAATLAETFFLEEKNGKSEEATKNSGKAFWNGGVCFRCYVSLG